MMRNAFTRRTALGVGTVSAAALALGMAVGPATASDASTQATQANNDGYFIGSKYLPSASKYTPWSAGSPRNGLPSPMYTCIKKVLPKKTSGYRLWSSDGSAEIREIITEASSTAKAKSLVKELRNKITNCDDILDDVEDIDRIGSWSTEDGLTLDAVYTAPEDSEYHLTLFAVGRDGRNIVITTFSDQGRQGDAPISAFTKTAKNALSRAF